MGTVKALDRPGLLHASLEPEEGIGLIRMCDEKSRNALGHEMVAAIAEAFDLLGRDQRVKSIVLAGLEEVFCSGASPGVLEDLRSGRRGSAELLLPRILLDCPLPCLSAMAGHAVGGGFALGIAADIVVLAAESRYCLNFLDLGFTPGMGTTRLFEHVLSPAQAHELMYTGEARLGRDFERRSGVNHVLPRAQVLSKTMDLAARIAEKPRLAVSALKQSLSSPRRQVFEAARTLEAQMHGIFFSHPDSSAKLGGASEDEIHPSHRRRNE
ncbi:MAG: enoyl-CoA hydratase/isomerase family protein [Alphaproteobacteria bacterium]|nr:enoyl-CoA hydratase/isomerase family protein [Alphaproteobacteria bacterium]